MDDVEEQKFASDLRQRQRVHKFSWRDVHVTVKDRITKRPKHILQGGNGLAYPGELVALMGPSGCGKTTLLNVLAQRPRQPSTSVEARIKINDTLASPALIRNLACFVEQDDALVGSLTVRETIDFAARLSLPPPVRAHERRAKVDHLLASFGLTEQVDTLVGTPIRKGISGGQKRRLSIASQLVTNPDVLFLDEPTSGLDSVASFEVVSYLRSVAKTTNLIVIASIHQPSTSTFDSFDKLILLSQGRTAYSGPLAEAGPHFQGIGFPYPPHANPAEHLVDLLNVDFAKDLPRAQTRLDEILSSWSKDVRSAVSLSTPEDVITGTHEFSIGSSKPNLFNLTWILVHRSFIKSYRDVFAYGIRLAMYMGLAIMMGTVWLRLHTTQSSIQSFINAIFFGGAFMSFMAVAYIPAFLEDRALYIKERANGLYGPTAFMIANFAVGLPYLFVITILFSVVAYWLTGFRSNADAFWIWVMWLYLDLLAAESLVIFISALIPIFVAALAITAFANGLWMCVGGFLVPPHTLNVFWRYVFHYIDYQAYVFQGMMVNEFEGRTYDCGLGCNCMYVTELASQCKIDGKGILDAYGYKTNRTGEWVGILIAIVAIYRLLGFIVLAWRRT